MPNLPLEILASKCTFLHFFAATPWVVVEESPPHVEKSLAREGAFRNRAACHDMTVCRCNLQTAETLGARTISLERGLPRDWPQEIGRMQSSDHKGLRGSWCAPAPRAALRSRRLQNMVRNSLGKSLAKFDPLFLTAQERLPGQALCKVSGQAV